jgi:transposase
MVALTDELAQEAVALLAQEGTVTAVARRLGLSRSTVQNRLNRASERGLDGRLPASLPQGQVVKGESVLYDEAGNIKMRWVKTKADQPTPEHIAEILKESFENYQAPYLNAKPQGYSDTDLLTVIPVADAHVGLFSWAEETGNDWDISIARRVIAQTTKRLIESTPNAGHCVILGGGDATHTNNFENHTAKSKNALDVDSRFSKVLRSACELFVQITDLALQKFPRVTVRILPGNHDETACFAIAYFLSAWYRNEPRVEVDTSPSLFWWYRFDNVLLGGVHGHTAKMKDMPQIMAVRRAEDWGRTQHRYIHTFHIHHIERFVNEAGGVICESHQSPSSQDAWHFNEGFLSGRSMQSVTYHRKHGEVTRNRIAIYDE